MLKARSAGARQTRSRTAKATPTKRASASNKKDAEEKKVEADADLALPNGSAADAAPAADGLQSPKEAPSPSALASLDHKGAAANSTMAGVPQTASADVLPTVTEPPLSQALEASTPADAADISQHLTKHADQHDAAVSMDVDNEKAVLEPSAPAAATPEAVAAAADETMLAEGGDEPTQPAVDQQGKEETSISREEESLVADPSEVELKAEEEVQVNQEETAKEEVDPGQVDPQAASKEQAEAQMAGGTLSMADAMEKLTEGNLDQLQATVRPNTAEADEVGVQTKPESNGEPHAQAGGTKASDEAVAAPKTDPAAPGEGAHKERSPAGLVSSVKGAGEADSRGVKRPAPAIARGAKQARTNQAAGRLLGNIRQQGTVKRTVIRGRVGARPAGMRLPPPMSLQGADPAKAAPADDKEDQDKPQIAVKADEKAATDFKDVMQQLLPAEQDPKIPPPKADTTPKTPKDSPEKQAGKQPQRSSLTAKASTPKRQDQVTTKSTGPRASEKGREDPNRAHGGRQDANRHQQATRSGGKGAPPPTASGGARSGAASAAPKGSRYQGRDRPGPRTAPLGPRDAGVQKVRGRPLRPEQQPYDRAARHGPSRNEASAAPRGYPRNAGQAAGSRAGPYPPQGARSGRAVPTESQRPGASWARNASAVRGGPAPVWLPPPAARRAPGPERGAAATRAPRGDIADDHRARNGRAFVRAPVPDRAPPSAGGFPVGRQRNVQVPSRMVAGPAHAGPSRGRVDRPAPAPRASNAAFGPQPDRLHPQAPPPRGVRGEPMRYAEPPPRYNSAAVPNQRAARHDAVPHRGAGNRLAPAGPRGGNPRATPAQHFSPHVANRQPQQQHPANFRSPVAPVQLPSPRLGPAPRAAPPGLGVEEYAPRGGRHEPSSQVDRPRSRSRGPPPSQRGPPYSDRVASRPRQSPAAQQLRSATYPQEQPPPQQYHPELAPAQAPHYDQQHAGPYAPQPLPARRGGLDRAAVSGDRYGPGPAARGSSQQWQAKPVQSMDMAAAPEYHQQRQPVGRDEADFSRQGYAAQQRGADVHMSDAHPGQTDRRTDRRGRGSRDRGDARRQRIDDRAVAPADNGRYAQGRMDQEYAPGPAADGYAPRAGPPLTRSHGYHEEPRGPDTSYMPPQQHVQSGPPRYDSPVGGYAPLAAQDPHQPVYGSGPVAPQGYTTAAAQPIDRQPYYPQQQHPVRQAPVQQQYADPPQYTQEPAYSAGSGSFVGGPQGGYRDAPPAQAPRGGYAQAAPIAVPHHRGEEYDPAYPGPSRAQAYSVQPRQSQTAPVSHGGVSHDGHAPRGGARGAGPSQQWAPSPREQSYGGPTQGSGSYGGQPSQRQGAYSSGPAAWSGNSSRGPQEMYPPQQQMGSSRTHAPQGGYGR